METPAMLPLETIPSKARYVVFSPRFGLVSEHWSPADAARGMIELARKQGVHAVEEAAIYRREFEEWKIL